MIAKRNSGLIQSACSETGALAGKNSTESKIWSGSTKSNSWRTGVSISKMNNENAVAIGVRVTADTLTVDLSDGRSVAAPLAWFPRLRHANVKERGSWRLIGGGHGIHWPDLDEDISVANLLAGQPSGESQRSFKNWLTSRDDQKRKKRS